MATLKPNNTLHIIIASLIGMMLEWYDFAVFAFLAPILSTVFFPHNNPHVSLLLTYSVYAIGYFVRPLSGVLFGHFGDRYGRRKVLLITILMMAVPTALIGALPTYAQVGVLAPLLVLFLRIIQGFSVGGESAGALILAFESAPIKLRGFISTLTWMGTGVGILLASGMVALISFLLTHQQLDTWGWRIPLFLGLFTAIPGYMIRAKLSETPEFSEIESRLDRKKLPIVETFQQHKRIILKIVMLYAPIAILFFLVFVYPPAFFIKMNYLPPREITPINTLSLIIMLGLAPVMGFLSDKFGRRKFLLAGAFAMVIFSWPLYSLILTKTLSHYFFGQMGFTFILDVFVGGLVATSMEMIPTNIRYSLMAFAYNVSNAVFNGTAPIIISYLSFATYLHKGPALYLTAISLLMIPAALTAKPLKKYAT